MYLSSRSPPAHLLYQILKIVPVCGGGSSLIRAGSICGRAGRFFLRMIFLTFFAPEGWISATSCVVVVSASSSCGGSCTSAILLEVVWVRNGGFSRKGLGMSCRWSLVEARLTLKWQAAGRFGRGPFSAGAQLAPPYYNFPGLSLTGIETLQSVILSRTEYSFPILQHWSGIELHCPTRSDQAPLSFFYGIYELLDPRRRVALVRDLRGPSHVDTRLLEETPLVWNCLSRPRSHHQIPTESPVVRVRPPYSQDGQHHGEDQGNRG